jgi:hypothetical protein
MKKKSLLLKLKKDYSSSQKLSLIRTKIQLVFCYVLRKKKEIKLNLLTSFPLFLMKKKSSSKIVKTISKFSKPSRNERHSKNSVYRESQ